MPSKIKKPATKKKEEDKQKEQSERFIETARTLRAEDNGVIFESAFAKLVGPIKKSRKPTN